MAIIGTRNFTTVNIKQDTPVESINNAEMLLQYAEIHSIRVIPIDVIGIARLLNIEVIEKDFSAAPEISSKIFKDKNGGWVIEINKTQNENRKRYAIAHNIGHFCLHKKDHEDEIFYRERDDTNKEECQANDFAGKILIPEDDFLNRIRSGHDSIEELSEIYGVSSLAIRIRAKRVGVTGHGL